MPFIERDVSPNGCSWLALYLAAPQIVMTRTRLSVPKMDCVAEERLVRMALDGCSGIRRIDADLRSRQLTIVHEGNADEIEALLQPLNLGARVSDSGPTTESQADEPNALANVAEARTLRIVLAINAAMFVAELLGAFFADSSALLADSLDMFADAVVYGLALFGVHRARSTQLKAAHLV